MTNTKILNKIVFELHGSLKKLAVDNKLSGADVRMILVQLLADFQFIPPKRQAEFHFFITEAVYRFNYSDSNDFPKPIGEKDD